MPSGGSVHPIAYEKQGAAGFALADVEEICDRMAILHQGELRYVGSPAGCREQFGAATLEQAYLTCIA